MAFSYACDFNLRHAGAEAEEFVAEAARSWPPLWEAIPGVRSTLLLSNAFALGGPYQYRWRVDIDRLSTLAAIDDALKSDDSDWRRIRKHWFEARSAVQANLTEAVTGNGDYAASGDRDALIHWLVAAANGAGRKLAEEAGSIEGVVAAEAHRPVVAVKGYGSGADEHVWYRLAGLKALDSVAEHGIRDISAGQLFGEIREIDGSLFVGA
jgi:hypothetical protein